MGELLTPTHLMVIAVIAFLLFGGKKLPELGKGLGECLGGLKAGLNGLTEGSNGPGERSADHRTSPDESLK